MTTFLRSRIATRTASRSSSGRVAAPPWYASLCRACSRRACAPTDGDGGVSRVVYADSPLARRDEGASACAGGVLP